jgi:GH24 family phage-related lysozyme (muramidase)
MRHISRQGLDLICRFEGFSPIIYMCPAGYPTIGYGHLITEANKEQFLDGVDEDEALDLLRQDVAVAERAVLRLISVPLTQGQFDALVSFTFNLGAWCASTLHAPPQGKPRRTCRRACRTSTLGLGWQEEAARAGKAETGRDQALRIIASAVLNPQPSQL